MPAMEILLGILNSDSMEFCILCKEIVGKRFSVRVRDKSHNSELTSYVCKDCYDNFRKSHNNEGIFKISQLKGWLKRKTAGIRDI